MFSTGFTTRRGNGCNSASTEKETFQSSIFALCCSKTASCPWKEFQRISSISNYHCLAFSNSGKENSLESTMSLFSLNSIICAICFTISSRLRKSYWILKRRYLIQNLTPIQIGWRFQKSKCSIKNHPNSLTRKTTKLKAPSKTKTTRRSCQSLVPTSPEFSKKQPQISFKKIK